MLLTFIKHISLYKLVLFLLFVCRNTVNSQILREVASHPNWKLLNYGSNCGHSTQSRIIGGDKATLGQYPWIARLGYGTGFEMSKDGALMVDIYECGGTIISERYVLTAAHCSPEVLGIELLKVRLGEHDVHSNPDCVGSVCAPPVQDIDVEEYSCHSGYNKNYHNDICLLRVAHPIQFNEYVAPICLPVYNTLKKDSFEGKVMEVAGWGLTDIHSQALSNILMTLKVPVINHNTCEMLYIELAKIVKTQMCAGGVVGKDSCSGDSGGPLMRPFAVGGPPRYFIIGVVSFGPTYCAESETPGIYTKVTDYLTWILDNVKQ